MLEKLVVERISARRVKPEGIPSSISGPSRLPEATAADMLRCLHQSLASFIDLEGQAGAEALRAAAEARRHGKREMNFNCFDVIIDADAGTVTFDDVLNADMAPTVISLDDVLRDLGP